MERKFFSKPVLFCFAFNGSHNAPPFFKVMIAGKEEAKNKTIYTFITIFIVKFYTPQKERPHHT